MQHITIAELAHPDSHLSDVTVARLRCCTFFPPNNSTFQIQSQLAMRLYSYLWPFL